MKDCVNALTKTVKPCYNIYSISQILLKIKGVIFMRKGRLTAIAVSAFVLLQNMSFLTAGATDPASAEVDALQYTYEIIPLLEPFNEYFYIRTDNPHPESFRFSDKDSPYSETSVIELSESLYADVVYENPELYRVSGGYIFSSGSTNGGEVTLQIQEEITEEEFNTVVYGTPDPGYSGYSPYHGIPVDCYKQYWEGGWSYSILGYYKWVDTDITITLPSLCDDCDYLISQYASGSDFFSDMDAVQAGFSDICLYSGSYIRGEVYRSETLDWRLSPAGHTDQIFYIYSPYSRRDNESLFASALYPYRYDSLGFPAMMGQVSARLDASSTYEWDSYSHADINVTCNGETRTYGGQGNGEGQGVEKENISHVFDFNDSAAVFTLDSARALLDEYAAIEMEDDIPREEALTWEKICNTVGDGAWVDMGRSYTYLYQADDRAYFYADEFGVGDSIYWWGSLGTCTDMWVDGRYINKAECFVRGAAFEEHPDCPMLLTEITLPELVDFTWTWDPETQSSVYLTADIVEKEMKNAVFTYDAERDLWIYSDSYMNFEALVEQGVADESYLDALSLTREEMAAIIDAGKTDCFPENGYFFDGKSPQGTPFVRGDGNDDGKASVADMVLLHKWLLHAPDAVLSNWRNVDLNEDDVIDGFDLSILKRELVMK